MFELSVNIEYMFHEVGEDLADRVRAAAAAGYRKVELFNTAGKDLASLKAALDEHGVTVWTAVTDPRIALFDPENHAGFIESFRRAAEDARLLGCGQLVVPSGIGVPFLKRPVQLENVARAIAAAADIAEELDIVILLEAVNTRVDHPGVLFSRTEDSVSVARAVDSPRVRVLYDLYHSITEGENPFEVLPQASELVAHVQIADVPGRGEPGSGTVDWPAMLELLASTGYSGTLGVECNPTRHSTAAALEYIRELCTELPA